MKDEITSEIKNLLAESQKEMLNLLKSRINTNSREEPENEPEDETRSFYTPTKLVRINSTQNNDSYASRNNKKAFKSSQNDTQASKKFLCIFVVFGCFPEFE